MLRSQHWSNVSYRVLAITNGVEAWDLKFFNSKIVFGLIFDK